MAEESVDTAEYQPARLIPTSGIRGAREREVRATSALLSVLGAVDEFGRAILRKRFGAPDGAVTSFIEVPMTLGDGREVRPDGLIHVRRGKRFWSAIVEVKTGSNDLDAEQVCDYLDAARERSIDAVITISNQLMPATGEHPVTVPASKLRKVALHHISWVALLTEAVMEHQHRGVADPEQAWILEELIAYLEHPNSGALQFGDMGSHWTTVRNAARDGTLSPRDEGIDDVISRWDELARFLALQLGRSLGEDVQQVLSRSDAQDPAARRRRMVQELADAGTLECELRIPGAAGPVTLEADLGARSISASMAVAAPVDRRSRARVNWVVRQLRDTAPENLRIDTHFERRAATTSKLLGALTEDPDAALLADRKIAPRAFRITLSRDMGMGRGSDQRSFIGSLTALLDDFHATIASRVRLWVPRAPRLPDARDDAAAVARARADGDVPAGA